MAWRLYAPAPQSVPVAIPARRTAPSMPATGTQLRFGAVLALLAAATPAASLDGNATVTTDYV